MPIKDPAALLARLLKREESAWLEFKTNNADPQTIGKTLSACANAAILAGQERAYIVWGIADKARSRVGTTLKLQDVKIGGENLQNWLSRLVAPRLMMEFCDFEDAGKSYAILAVEPSYERPVKFSGCEYIRLGENVKPLADFPDHERALWLATGRYRFESAIALPHQTEDQLFALLDTSVYYKLRGDEVPPRQSEIIRTFRQRGFLRDDNEGGHDITNLGALLFASDIRHFPSISGKSIRVIQYSGKDKAKSVGETEGTKGYAVGFPGLLRFITNKLPTQERIVDGVRRALPTYSEIAIREIVANALIHQDFTISGSCPVIEIYDDRLEIANPGNSLIGVDRMIDDRRSRNEKLAAAMRELGLCEERGSGIDKAIIDIEERSLPAPEFFFSEDAMKVVIFGPKAFRQLSKADKVWACFCHCVVRYIRRDYMTNTTLRKRFSLSDDEYQAASSVIADTRQAGKIVEADPEQGRRNARYVPYWAAP